MDGLHNAPRAIPYVGIFCLNEEGEYRGLHNRPDNAFLISELDWERYSFIHIMLRTYLYIFIHLYIFIIVNFNKIKALC